MRRSGYNPFTTTDVDVALALPETERFPAAGHRWTTSELDALALAFTVRRPLLVRGEPGSGKSQIARAAARVLGSDEPLCEVIHPRFEATDLLYRFDPIARLADAQVEGKLDQSNERYVQHGVLWQAYERCGPGAATPVVLIDEIDKADADVPNSLLEALGTRSFAVPWLKKKHVRAPDGQGPLIVVTTNEERELPAAFVRRCVVLNLNPPADPARLREWLIARASVHHQLDVAPAVRERAADQVLGDREAATRAGYPRVGLAEYIDLLAALSDLTSGLEGEARERKQAEWLDRLADFVLKKHPGQVQRETVQRETPAPAEDPGSQ